MARRHRQQFLELTSPPRRYLGGMASKIRGKVEQLVIPLSSHTWYWQRAMRWIKQFRLFADDLMLDEGKGYSTTGPEPDRV